MSETTENYKSILRRSKYVFMLLCINTNETCDFDVYADSEPEAWLALTTELGAGLSNQTIIVNHVYKLNSIKTVSNKYAS